MYLSAVDGVADYRVRGAEVAFDVELATTRDLDSAVDGTHTLTVAFYDERVANVFFSPNTTRAEYVESLALDVDRLDGPGETAPDVSVEEVDGEVWIETASLAVVVDTDDGGFRLVADGRTLTSTDAATTDARGRPLVKPLGFTETEVERWPLTVAETHLSLALHPGESVYGFGEEFGTLDKRGRRIEATVDQALGVGSDRTYKSVPFFASSRGYGVLVETSTAVSFDVGATAPDAVEIVPDSDALSLTFVAAEDVRGTLERYTRLTGRAEPLPKWAYGVWMSRNSYADAEAVRSVVERLDDEGIHVDVVHLDPTWMGIDDGGFELRWDDDRFPDPEGLLDDLAAAGVRVSLWEYPYVHRGTPAFETANRKGYLVESPESRPYVVRRLSSSSLPYTQVGIVDFTNPEAVAWWRERHVDLLDDGVAAFKLDFGEYLPTDGVTSDGRTGATVHNLYPTLYAEAVTGAFEAAGEPPVLWNRAGWAGSQSYPVHWGGDPASTYDAMAASFRGGLSLGLSGFQHWSCDVGGYAGDPSSDLYVRWLQWTLLATTNPRFHGTTPREPWAFGDRALGIARRYVTERYELFPYVYSLATRAADTGLPPFRPMVLEFPDADVDLRADTQCMFGDALLVAPVLEPSGAVDVALPAGDWVDYWSGERVSGGRTLRRRPDLEDLPVFLRAGRLLAKRDDPDRATSALPGTLRLILALPADGDADDEFVYRPDARTAPITIRVATREAGDEVRVSTSAPLPVSRLAVVLAGTDAVPDAVHVDGTAVAFDVGTHDGAPPGTELLVETGDGG